MRKDEKASLIVSQNSTHGMTPSPHSYRKSLEGSGNFLEKSLSGRFSGHAFTSQKAIITDQSQVLDHAILGTRTGIVGFIVRYKRQILVNLFAFFMLGALYSFEVYAVNFVGEHDFLTSSVTIKRKGIIPVSIPLSHIGEHNTN